MLISKYPNAYLLLSQIAIRAKWKDCPISGLKAGEAEVGDWKEAGLASEMTYRHANKILAKLRLATFRGTTSGTIATLKNSMIFSLSAPSNNEHRNDQTTDQQETGNERGTTNHKDTQSTQNTTKHVTDSALAESERSPLSTKTAIEPLMTLDAAKQCVRKIREEQVKAEPYGNFALVSREDFDELAMDWHIKAEQSGWIMKKEPIPTMVRLRAIEIDSKLAGHFASTRVEVEKGSIQLDAIGERAKSMSSALRILSHS